jgi:uncharacterized low-complexity protein
MRARIKTTPAMPMPAPAPAPTGVEVFEADDDVAAEPLETRCQVNFHNLKGSFARNPYTCDSFDAAASNFRRGSCSLKCASGRKGRELGRVGDDDRNPG